MIKNKTVIVVGAGASNDLGLPLGAKLRHLVADLIGNPNNPVYNYIRTAAKFVFDNDDNRATRAMNLCGRYADPLKYSASIDNFLDQHKDEGDFVVVAKMAVAYVIADAEKNSSLGNGLEGHSVAKSSPDYFLNSLLNIWASIPSAYVDESVNHA